jgi:stringent starvation protein B
MVEASHMQAMTTRRPYLIRAFNDWILDNGLTPYLSVNADYKGVEVPREFVIDGEVLLNISPSSVRNLELGQEYILFDARFSGHAHHVAIPVKAVIAIFARENGEGMAFMYEKHEPVTDVRTQEMILKSIVQDERDDDGPDDPSPKPPSGRPNLKVVK